MTNQVIENAVDQNANLLAEMMIPASNVLIGDRFQAQASEAPCGNACGAGCGGGCHGSL